MAGLNCISRPIYIVGYLMNPDARMPGAVIGQMPAYILGFAGLYQGVRDVFQI